MAPTGVAVIGAGIAGPVLGIFLKSKGYEPVIFERTEGLPTTGVAHGVQPNGLAVLDRIPGLVDHLPGFPIDGFNFYSVIPEDKGELARVDAAQRRREANPNAPSSRVVRRSELQRALVDFAQQAGVEVRWGHKLESLEQQEESVTVRFANGTQETFSFVVGCDGLHSNTRQCLFGSVKADYTGLTQTGGFSPRTGRFQETAYAMNVFGENAHMIALPVSEDVVGWAVTQREAEAKETWKQMDAEAVKEFKKSPVSEWDFGAGELVKTGYDIVKYGLYDRLELKSWHQGRVVLIGDAAHPTNPHLGQGANQSMEDVGLLIDLLEQHNPGAASPSTATLEAVFCALEQERIPRTADLVKRARAQGETRVVSGTEACIKRNNWYRELMTDENALRQRFGVRA